MRKLLLIIILFTKSGFAQIINEICPSNTVVHEDFFVGFLDWVEIYNPSATPVSLIGYTFSDDLSEPDQWPFPFASIPGESYITITAADDPVLAQTINFAFPRRGRTLYMFDSEGDIVDSIAYPRLQPNHSYGLIESQYYYFGVPTPGHPNNTEIGYKGYANAPEINLLSGDYAAETELVLTPVLPSETVFYTYNGRGVDAGILYESPFEITKTRSIRAIATADSMLISSSTYRTYFVNEHHDLPVINLGVDSLDLFDNVEGIFMMGPDAVDTSPFLGANFWKDQEVHVYYEYFDKDFELADSMNCHIEVFGGIGSRWRDMKSIQLRGKNTYDKSYFRYEYFEGKELDKFRRLVLRNGGNDFCNSCMKDAALHNYFIESGLNVDLLAYNPVVVYINGHYWGIQNMREKADRYYVESNYNLDPDEVNLLGQATLDEIDGEATEFIALTDYANGNDLASDLHYNWVDDQLDINSFVDYFLIQLYVNNRDWPNFNLKVWNAVGHEKWRYLLYDMDVGLKYNGTSLPEQQSLAFILNNAVSSNPHVQILEALLANEAFRRYFINRYCDLLNTAFDAQAIYASISDQKEKIESEMGMHYPKWCGSIASWHERFIGQKGFIDGRELIIHHELAEVFELPQAVDLTIDVFPAGAATVQLNSLALDEFPFAGSYFNTNVIDLTAEIKLGELFKYWENHRTKERLFELQIQVDPEDQDEWVVVCHSNEIAEIDIVPNPAENEITVSFSLTSQSPVEISVVDLQGKEVMSTSYPEFFLRGRHKINMDLSQLLAGHYILFITTSYGREASQIIKL